MPLVMSLENQGYERYIAGGALKTKSAPEAKSPKRATAIHTTSLRSSGKPVRASPGLDTLPFAEIHHPSCLSVCRKDKIFLGF
jgi:hypothetical protein